MADKRIAELLIERARLVAYGLVHAVALIDAELKRLGIDESGAPLKREASSSPVGRKAPGKSTA